MPQLQLPLIPPGASEIGNLVSVWRDENKWTYFIGMQPIYSHHSDDNKMFRIITSQLIDSGACRAVDITKTFGVSKSSVMRSLRKLRKGGIEAFFVERRGRRGGNVLTDEVLKKGQNLLDQGYSRKDAAEELGVKYDTLRKAIEDGRLNEQAKNEVNITKSSRNVADAEAADGMGTACTRVSERVLASVGRSAGANMNFEICMDVPNGGVLCALPFLLANGLLKGAEKILGKLKGYYTTLQILLLMAFMALCRIKAVEKLKKQAPGEFGKLLGLDRIPEVKCLRKKMDELSEGDSAEIWAAHMSRYWMESDPDAVGTLYVDGHVRTYHGNLTKLPKRYVSREKLCLRGTTDYWVNDAIGLPFFVVEKVVDPGLLNTLRDNIVPRLLKDVPNQPTEDQLNENPYLCRFIIVFDREGYSPEYFCEMWKNHRIACMTYHKYPAEAWPEERFTEHKVIMPRGEEVTMRLGEMGSFVGSDKKGMWMREVRKLTETGHQTSIISTAFDLPHTHLAVRMFSRWCQENFFRYMIQHFDIDMLLEYGVEKFPDTERVVNPTWRDLEKQRNSVQNKLRHRRARFAEMTMHPESENDLERYENWVKKKSSILEEIEQYEHQLTELKNKLKNTEKHITWDQLEEKDKFSRLLPGRRRLMDTIRMIAYRAETAMVSVLKSQTVSSSDARRLLQYLFVTEADLLPDPDEKKLRIRLHSASNPSDNRALIPLITYLNECQVEYPGTDMILTYEIRGYTDITNSEGVS